MEHVTSRDGTQICVHRTGVGPPVLVIGGALSDHTGALPLAAELAGDATVVAYDRRSRGGSGDASPGVAGSVERELEDLAAVLAVTGDEPTIVAKSSGAVLALAAAAAGLTMNRLVLFEPPFTTPDFPPTAPEDLPEQLAALVAAGRGGDAVELFLVRAVGFPAELVAQMRASPAWPAMEAFGASTVYDAELTRRFPRPESFASVTVPALVLTGEETWPLLSAAADALADVLPSAERRTVAGSDHQLDAPAVADVVRAVLHAG